MKSWGFSIPGIRHSAALSVASLVLGLGACGGSDAGSAQPGAPGAARGPIQFPVEVQTVAAQPVEYAVAAVGSVEAFETVAVTARVQGAIETVRFTEGDLVGTGQVLAEIEPRRYRLALDAANAALERAQASLAEAEAGLERREAVNRKNPDLVKAEDVDAFRTRARVAAAEGAEQRAAVEVAELNLHDAYVRAPVAGVIQTRTLQTGQYVQPGTVLATLVRRDPLLLRFRVPESEAAPLRTGQPARFTVRGDATIYRARLLNVGAQASEATRMVEVTAEVDDERRGALRPGAFAEVTVPVGASGVAPVVPQSAVRPSERGFLAFVVEDGVARERVLELGLRTAEGLVEVKSGVRAGESLVVSGAEALRDGAAVRAEDAGAAAKKAAGKAP
jgi:multidrug efflux system membrane fusion protein